MRSFLLGVAMLLLAAGCASSAPRSPSGGHAVVGRVLSAPSCPVERAGMRCPPRPVAGATVDAVQNGAVVATTHSGTDGRFRLELAAGHYVIRATNVGGYASTAQRAVIVSAQEGPAILVRLVVDSGIR